MNRRDFRLGPWSTSLDSGSRLELSAYWKRRMQAIADLPHASRRFGRGMLGGALVVAALLAATPLMDFSLADAAMEDTPPVAAAAETAPARKFLATFSNGVEIELIGVSSSPSSAESWRGPDGLPLAAAPYKPIQVPRNIWNSPMLREFCWRWRGADDPDFRTSWDVEENTNGWGPVQPSDADGRLIKDLTAYVVPFTVIRPTCTLRFTMSFPGSKWQAYWQGQGGHVSSYVSHPPGQEVTGVTFDKPRTMDGGAFVVMGFKFADNAEARLIAIDPAGKRHIGQAEAAGNLMGFRQLAVQFPDLQPTEMRAWLVERRTRLTETVEFRNVSLDPQTPTVVQIVRNADEASEPRGEGADQAPATAELAAMPDYGAIGEVVLRGNMPRQLDLIDFDTGITYAPEAAGLENAGPEWLAEHGIDAAGCVDSDLKGLTGFDFIAVRTEPENWDDADKLPEHLRGAKPDGNAPMDGREPPATYFFQTREGARGVLQIVEVIPNEAVKIRYKLAK